MNTGFILALNQTGPDSLSQMPKNLKVKLFVWAHVVLLPLDQITKYWARQVLQGEAPQHYLGGLFRLQYAENTGAFLSLGAGLSEPLRKWIFVIFVGLFLVGASVYVFRSAMSSISSWGFCLIIAGGFGNLIDRGLFGRVSDFMLMVAGPLRTGIFNIADMAILFGIILVALEGPIEKQLAKKNG
ncbi:MAG: signal peptidase II [Bdellovibrionaceae bacterium]|nr:signal peptidase II [Pseudobdellovibrionaceae bacterium]